MQIDLQNLSHAEHPRVRGENCVGTLILKTYCGTSPHTRGKPTTALDSGPVARNIPAHAGKTDIHTSHHHTGQEHPRTRGENSAENCRKKSLGGTSPHTRGKQVDSLERYGYPRNIPAHAGKTWTRGLVAGGNTEHPRTRGENNEFLYASARQGGTSPHTRGKHGGGCLVLILHGNIPAHAGKTSVPYAPLRLSAEHPRTRGENHQ